MGCCHASFGDSDVACSRSPGRRFLVDIIENEVENVALSAVRHGFRDQVNQKDLKGQTPLCAAVERNVYSLRLIDELITAGAKVNKAGYDGVPPVYRALEKLRFDIVELLLGYNAQIPYKMNSTAYQVVRKHNAVLKGWRFHSVLGSLWNCIVAIFSANTKTLKLLLNAGLDPNFVEPVCKRTLFMQAVIVGSVEICQVLLEGDADPCKRDCCGLTCLHEAVKHHAVDTLQLLLDHGAIDVNDDCNTSSLSPLHMLRCAHPFNDVEYKCICYDIVVALVEAGATIDSPSGRDGVLSMAVTKSRLSIVKYLMSKCQSDKRDEWMSSICRAACTHTEMVDYLLDLVLDTPQNPFHRHRVIEQAVLLGHEPALERLLAVNPDISHWNTFSTDLLLLAVQKNSYSTCRLLLQHGADPNTHNHLGFSLQISCSRENCLDDPSIVKLLLSYGTNVNVTDHGHGTPLHLLVDRYPHTDPLLDPAVRMFVCNGLDKGKHYWLLDRLMPGVPFGRPALRSWLTERLSQPAPLFHQCILFFRSKFQHRLHQVTPQLPIPPLMQDFLLLRDVFNE
ncbi:hypothetical protein CAPTEDRAFT_227865 [Capitella teleta]|uniref:SOCS box domain-containing protein n=1 Tax=Capitella teleta TaxID=283909 RepID=R7U8F8_CAPTE|nr:hypothetical protein CAPTEDRAFT_227865 [Capitella teleta]|eukprot:ELU02269.1 hypothetical protein CAPTEDRAFT_227865 [Capitella teleta]